MIRRLTDDEVREARAGEIVDHQEDMQREVLLPERDMDGSPFSVEPSPAEVEAYRVEQERWQRLTPAEQHAELVDEARTVEQVEREATALRVELLNLKTTFDVERTTRLAAERACEQVRRERDTWERRARELEQLCADRL